MKKFFVFIISVVIIYVVFFQKMTPVRTTMKDQIEDEADLVSPSAKTVEIPKHGTSLRPQNIRTDSPYFANTIQPKIEINKETAEKPTPKFRQLEEGDGTYAPTPSILTGMSAKIFSMYYPTDVRDSILPDVEVKDVQSAFATGIYPFGKILKALNLEGPFSGYVWTNAGPERHKLSWNLKIDHNSNPVQGIFSLKVNGVEKSCNATTLGPLKNISFLAEDNGAIIVASCDKSFFLQLYRSGSEDMNGSYFEKSTADEKYRPTRELVMLLRGTAF